MLISSSKFFFFFRTRLIETVIRIVLCPSYQACCPLYYLCKINNGIHICQFTFEILHFSWFPDVVVVSDLNKNIGGSTDLAEKRHGGDGVKKEFFCLPQTMILIKVKGLIQKT